MGAVSHLRVQPTGNILLCAPVGYCCVGNFLGYEVLANTSLRWNPSVLGMRIRISLHKDASTALLLTQNPPGYLAIYRFRIRGDFLPK